LKNAKKAGNTIGAVVRPADSIIVVVPAGSTLVVEAAA
jgi:hypothetical protein